MKSSRTISGNKLLTISPVLLVVKSRTTSLLTTDVKTRTLIGVRREIIKEAMKSINIAPKVVARRSNAMGGDILLTTVE